jgi:hypothetical protein
VIRQPRGRMLLCDNTRETGVYRLQTPDGDTVYYVVQPDGQESDLTPASEEDRERVAAIFNPLKLEQSSLRYTGERSEIIAAPESTDARQEVWWCFLLGLIGLLCAEVWMTRRMVMHR